MKKITLNSPEYPPLLKEIPGPPEVLHFLGELPAENEPVLAVVGTRKATREGAAIARSIAAELSKSGVVIASGLALGIDAAAHEGALAAGGKTVAVLGSGLTEIYPRQNEKLAEKIIKEKGALISEYPPGTTPYPSQFLERNRIISGLSLATVVIEAPERSGSLVTARLALEAGREVFVVPGSANHQNYRGSHRLIREGARLAANAEEILLDLENTLQNFNLQLTTGKNISPEQKRILEIMKDSEYLNTDEIIELSGFPPQIVMKELTAMQLNNLIIEEKGKFKLR